MFGGVRVFYVDRTDVLFVRRLLRLLILFLTYTYTCLEYTDGVLATAVSDIVPGNTVC